MKSKPLWQLSVLVAPEAEEAVAEWLGNAFGQPASSHTDLETGLTTVSLFFGSASILEKSGSAPKRLAASFRAEIHAGLARIKSCGLSIGPGAVALKSVPRQDWAESWKRHFKPIAIGSALLLKPSWSRKRPRKGQSVVVLDPGLSFGTGQHPTTAFCLGQLVRRRKAGKPQSLLDAGTGSGILAIAAAKLGYAPVEAFDFDPDAVRIGRQNARRNRVAARIRLSRRDVTKLPSRSGRKFSVVCANLTSNLLLSERGRLLARLESEGTLVLAGILETEFPRVQQAYESAGMRLAASQTRKEWRSGAFVHARR